jgi:hypothetical protein
MVLSDSLHFMEPQSSLPHSQQPQNSPYSPKDQPILCSLHHLTSRRSILILSYLRLCLPSGLFISVLPTNFYTILPVPNSRYMLWSYRQSWSDHPNIILWGVKIIKLFGMYSSPFPIYFFFLRHKYPPQHPILEHPQTIKFMVTQCISDIQHFIAQLMRTTLKKVKLLKMF